MKIGTLLPINQKIKQKIKEFGDKWIILMERDEVICLPGTPACLIIPNDGGPKDPSHPQLRWVPKSAIL